MLEVIKEKTRGSTGRGSHVKNRRKGRRRGYPSC